MELLAEHPGRLAFSGLRRTLGAHPESLTRALRRLERDGRVTHDSDGYTLRLDGAVPVAPRSAAPARPSRTIASVRVPPGVSADAVLGALAGRWFGPLRWVGVYEVPGEPLLVWSVSGTDGHVLLSTRRGQLRVAIDSPSDGEAVAEIEAAAQRLLAHALPRLRPPDRVAEGSVRWLSAGALRSRWTEN